MYAVCSTQAKDIAVRYLCRLKLDFLASFLSLLPSMSVNAVIVASGTLSAGELRLNFAFDMQLAISSFGLCPFCIPPINLYFLAIMTGAHFPLPFAPLPTPFSCASSAPAPAPAPAPATRPSTWSCPASYYGTKDGCNCNCGALDPDCASASATLSLFNCPGSRAQGWSLATAAAAVFAAVSDAMPAAEPAAKPAATEPTVQPAAEPADEPAAPAAVSTVELAAVSASVAAAEPATSNPATAAVAVTAPAAPVELVQRPVSVSVSVSGPIAVAGEGDREGPPTHRSGRASRPEWHCKGVGVVRVASRL
jgi:hypothetical protein